MTSFRFCLWGEKEEDGWAIGTYTYVVWMFNNSRMQASFSLQLLVNQPKLSFAVAHWEIVSSKIWQIHTWNKASNDLMLCLSNEYSLLGKVSIWQHIQCPEQYTVLESERETGCSKLKRDIFCPDILPLPLHFIPSWVCSFTSTPHVKIKLKKLVEKAAFFFLQAKQFKSFNSFNYSYFLLQTAKAGADRRNRQKLCLLQQVQRCCP